MLSRGGRGCLSLVVVDALLVGRRFALGALFAAVCV